MLKKGIFMLFVLALIIPFVHGLNLSFSSPTPLNNSMQNGLSIFVNMTNANLDQYYSFLDFDNSASAWWRMESNFDDSFGRYNGTCSGSLCPTVNLAGVFGATYNFNGVNQSINFPEPTNLNSISEISVSAWVYYPTSAIGLTYGIVGDYFNGGWLMYRGSGFMLFDVVNTTLAEKDARVAHTFNQWVHYVGTYNGSEIRIYKNGVLGNTTAMTGTLNTPLNQIRMGQFSNTFYLNGSIDEVVIFNRTLSPSEVLALYNSSANRYSNNFTNLIFKQYSMKGYSANKTSQSETELRLITIADVPVANFNYQLPSDLSTSTHSANISYNISATAPLNTSNINIFYKVNSTNHNECWVFVNGTNSKCGFVSKPYLYNISNSFTWILDDDDIYPSLYNLNSSIFHNTLHTPNLLTATSQFVKVRLFNVSSVENFNLVEAMVNLSSGTSVLNMYYCNSSYTTGNPSTSVNCNNFFNLANSSTFTEIENSSRYQYIPLAINKTSGSVGNVKSTSTSYFIFGISSSVSWNYYTIPTISRADTTQTSNNNGNTWSNFAGTMDLSLYQFDGNDTLSYYISACDSINGCANSSLRQDLLQLGTQPPSAPNLISPISAVYHFGLLINYTASISPNDYPIVKYNISLLNISFAFNRTIIENNSINLSYLFNSSTVDDGYYIIKVTACDNNSLCSDGFSNYFLIDNTPPYAVLINPFNETSTLNKTINFTVDAIDNVSLGNITLIIYNDSGNITSETLSTNATSGIFGIVYNFVSSGIYYWYYVVTDSVGNIFTTFTNLLNILPEYPIINITYPENISYIYPITSIGYTIGIDSQSCWYNLNNTNVSFTCGSAITGIQSTQGSNTWRIYSNNSVGNETSDDVTFSVNCMNPEPTLTLTSYPYVEINTTFNFEVSPFPVNNTQLALKITAFGNSTYYNLTYDDVSDSYKISLIFGNATDYSFVIYALDNVCPTLSQNLTGTLKVRESFDVTFRLFRYKSSFLIFSNAYENDFAYVTAEYSDNRSYETIERYIRPLYANPFKKSVFSAPYIDGEATLTLYDKDRFYGIRIIDGIIDFSSNYAVPNVTKSFGIEGYVGNYYLNGSDVEYDVYMPMKELRPYRTLFNWILFFLIIGALGVALILLFVIPEYHWVAIGTGVLIPIFLIAIRILLWVITGN
jgi:hypothetical protein